METETESELADIQLLLWVCWAISGMCVR